MEVPRGWQHAVTTKTPCTSLFIQNESVIICPHKKYTTIIKSLVEMHGFEHLWGSFVHRAPCDRVRPVKFHSTSSIIIEGWR